MLTGQTFISYVEAKAIADNVQFVDNDENSIKKQKLQHVLDNYLETIETSNELIKKLLKK